MFESALAAGIVSMGADVWLTGPLPTPGIAFITSSMRCDAGVVISASHNPFEDNGIKVFARDGYKLPDDVEAEIEALMSSPELDAQRAAPARHRLQPQASRTRAAATSCYCKATFPQRAHARRPARSSSTARTAPPTASAPAVFEELGAEGHRDPHQARRQEHQRARRRAAPAGDVRGGASCTTRTSASRSTATPTASCCATSTATWSTATP